MSDILTPNRAIEDPVIIDLAKELGKDPAQVILSWISQRGVVVLPKSVTPSRIQSNLEGKFPSHQATFMFYLHLNCLPHLG